MASEDSCATSGDFFRCRIVIAAGVKVIKLEGEMAKNYLATINNSAWDDAKGRKLTVPYDKIRALLYKTDGGS